VSVAIESLLAPTISTILIKGAPGVGKTTLALELLRRNAKGMYVSTRVSEEKLALQNPEIKMALVGGSTKETSPAGTKLNLQDLRLAGATGVLQLVFQRMMDAHGGLIVLDSWDSIAKELDAVERIKSEKSMVVGIQTSDSKLVFISEEPNLTTTDYLVDAIVELKTELYLGQPKRIMEIKKLRGQRILTPVSIYTLRDGCFEVFPETQALMPRAYQASKYIPVPNAGGRYSSGMPDIDEALGGGFFPGMTWEVEYGSGMTSYLAEPINQTIVANFVSNGGCSVILPASGVSPDEILTPLRSILSKDIVNASVRVGYYEESNDPCVFRLHPISLEQSISRFWQVVDKLKTRFVGPTFLMIGVEKLEYIHLNISTALKISFGISSLLSPRRGKTRKFSH
jgi:KaiC/GvpD/RAD55 family RecA-like ATPase